MTGLSTFRSVVGGSTAGAWPGRLTRHGLHFHQADGAIWKYRGITSFDFPRLWAIGERGLCQDWCGFVASIGRNAQRWFAGMWRNTDYSPKTIANFYDHNHDALIYLRDEWGQYVQYTMGCDQTDDSPVLLSVSEWDEHVRHSLEVVDAVGNAIVEIMNEAGKNDDFGYTRRVSRHPRVLMTRSWWSDNGDPQEFGTWLDWATAHTDRGENFAVKGKVLHEIEEQGLGDYPAGRVPALVGEKKRVADGGSTRQYSDSSLVEELYGEGGCIHGGYAPAVSNPTSDFQRCRVPAPNSQAMADCLAVQAVAECGLIPADASSIGRYLRGGVNAQNQQDDTVCPIVHVDKYSNERNERGAARSYFMQMPDGRMIGGAIDPGSQHQVVPRLGYHIVDRGGYEGNVLVLAR